MPRVVIAAEGDQASAMRPHFDHGEQMTASPNQARVNFVEESGEAGGLPLFRKMKSDKSDGQGEGRKKASITTATTEEGQTVSKGLSFLGKGLTTDNSTMLNGDKANKKAPAAGSKQETTAQARGGMFADQDDMKRKVREALIKPKYNVADFYHEKGIWRKIATHPVFETCTLGVISVNALWISIDTDLNGAATLLDAQPLFQYVEQFFCWYFSFEWYVRFSSFAVKRNGLRDAWFVFDSCLVFMMVTETWIMTIVLLLLGGSGAGSALGNASILRLLRLLRLSRLARMLRSMPELMILIKGMVAASRSVFFTMCLLVILLYLFAIAMRQLTEGTTAGDEFFPSVPQSMFKLLIEGVFLDNMGYTTDVLADSSPVFVVVFLVFVSLAALMVMNMLIGVLCEVVSVVASTEKEEMAVGALKWRLQQVMAELDQNNSGRLSEEEFGKLVSNKEAAMMLKEVGVDPESVIDMAPVIFGKEEEDDDDDYDDTPKEIDLEEFMSFVLELRDQNAASQKDLKKLKRDIVSEIEKLREDFGVKKVRRSSIRFNNHGDAQPSLKKRSKTAPVNNPLTPQLTRGFTSSTPSTPRGCAPTLYLPAEPHVDSDQLVVKSFAVEDFNHSEALGEAHDEGLAGQTDQAIEVERALEALKKALDKAQALGRQGTIPGMLNRDSDSDPKLSFSSWCDNLSGMVSDELQKLEKLRRPRRGSSSQDAPQERGSSPEQMNGTLT